MTKIASIDVYSGILHAQVTAETPNAHLGETIEDDLFWGGIKVASDSIQIGRNDVEGFSNAFQRESCDFEKYELNIDDDYRCEYIVNLINGIYRIEYRNIDGPSISKYEIPLFDFLVCIKSINAFTSQVRALFSRSRY